MNPIILHLANLKFYGLFRRSPAQSFDQYVTFRNLGSPADFDWQTTEDKPLIERFDYIDPLDDAEFEGDVEQYLLQKRLQENVPTEDLSSWLEKVISHIEYLASKEIGYLVLEANPFEVLKTILIKDEEILEERYQKLREYIGITTADFFKYTSWMQERPPEDFFSIFSEEEKKIENYPLIKCFPRIFVDCKAFAFFTELQKENLNQADQNFLYVQLTNDNKIHCTAKEFEDFLNDRLLEPVQIYGRIKGENPRFRPTYDHYHPLWY